MTACGRPIYWAGRTRYVAPQNDYFAEQQLKKNNG